MDPCPKVIERRFVCVLSLECSLSRGLTLRSHRPKDRAGGHLIRGWAAQTKTNLKPSEKRYLFIKMLAFRVKNNKYMPILIAEWIRVKTR